MATVIPLQLAPPDSYQVDDLATRFSQLDLAKPEQLSALFPKDCVNEVDSNGRSLLHYLVIFRKVNCIAKAIQMKVPLTLLDIQGHSALDLAIKDSQNCYFCETVHLLLQAANRDDLDLLVRPNAEGYTVVHRAAMNQSSIAKQKQSYMALLLQRIQTLLPDKVHECVNAKTLRGWTPLDCALACQNPSAIAALVAQGAQMPSRSANDIDDLLLSFKGDHVCTPLELEAITQTYATLQALDGKIGFLHRMSREKGCKQPVRELLKQFLKKIVCEINCISINFQNPTDGYTLGHIAAYLGDVISAQILLAKGASFEIPNGNGVLPIDLALINGHTEIYFFFKQSGFKTHYTLDTLIKARTSAAIAADLITTLQIPTNQPILLKAAFDARAMAWVFLLLNLGGDIREVFDNFKIFTEYQFTQDL